MENYTLEVCVDTLESAQNAILGGATRLELCSSLVIGGLSPSPTLYKQIRAQSPIPIHVMVRPRFGDFLYTPSEMDIMLAEVNQWRKLGANGIVAGILTPQGHLDVPRMMKLRQGAGDMNFTLHRAFDVAYDPMETLQLAKQIGITAILTAGQQNKAHKGLALIKQLNQNRGPVEIMPGSGLHGGNVALIREKTGVTAFHLSGNEVKDSPMAFKRSAVHMGVPGISEFERWICSSEKIAAVKKVLEEID